MCNQDLRSRILRIVKRDTPNSRARDEILEQLCSRICLTWSSDRRLVLSPLLRSMYVSNAASICERRRDPISGCSTRINSTAREPLMMTRYVCFQREFFRLVLVATLPFINEAARSTTSLSVISKLMRGQLGLLGGAFRNEPSPSSNPASQARSSALINLMEVIGIEPMSESRRRQNLHT